MRYNFPEVKTTRNIDDCVQKIVDEIKEFMGDHSDAEAIDILHAVETFIRVKFKGRNSELQIALTNTILKNNRRGYYTGKCF